MAHLLIIQPQSFSNTIKEEIIFAPEFYKQTQCFVGFGAPQDPFYLVIYSRSETKFNAGGLKLICPRCGQETREIKESEVVVDVCDKCRGMFLDQGELNKIA